VSLNETGMTLAVNKLSGSGCGAFGRSLQVGDTFNNALPWPAEPYMLRRIETRGPFAASWVPRSATIANPARGVAWW
jgi:hypothetical protein